MTTARWTRQPPDVRRRQILDAAADVLRRRGYDGMRVSEVAETAGVGKGTVYLYFDSKTALLTGLRDRYWQQMMDVVRAVVDAPDLSWRERLDRLVDDLVAYGAAEVATYHALFHDAPMPAGEPIAELTAAVAELLEHGVAAGAYELADTATTAAFLVGAFHGTGPLIIHLPVEQRPPRIEVLKDLFRRSVNMR